MPCVALCMLARDMIGLGWVGLSWAWLLWLHGGYSYNKLGFSRQLNFNPQARKPLIIVMTQFLVEVLFYSMYCAFLTYSAEEIGLSHPILWPCRTSTLTFSSFLVSPQESVMLQNWHGLRYLPRLPLSGSTSRSLSMPLEREVTTRYLRKWRDAEFVCWGWESGMRCGSNA